MHQSIDYSICKYVEGLSDARDGRYDRVPTPLPEPVTIWQLTAELHCECALNQLVAQSQTCITDWLTQRTIEHGSNASPVQQLWQILVDAVQQGLNSDHVALFWDAQMIPDMSTATPAIAQRGVLDTAFVLVANAPTSSADHQFWLDAVKQSTWNAEFTVAGWSRLQTQFPARVWPICDGLTCLGWLVVGADRACDRSSVHDRPFTSVGAPLRSRFITESLKRWVLVWRQMALMQAQVQQQQALIAQNRELAQTNQLKSEFLANTSHEIRTPLSSILGFTHLLREQGFSSTKQRHQEYLKIILTSGQHLLALINDILDLSKIEANQLDLCCEAIDVPTVCQTALTLVREKANDKGLTLKLEIAPDVQTLIADGLRVKQMLFNLLSNAIKFTSRGHVGLQVGISNAVMQFTVWDTGTGIAPDQQALLFRPYAQIANAAVGRDEGTGLGLALTQKLVELHGGWIEMQSTIGQGSRFTIALPLTPAACADVSTAQTVACTGAAQASENVSATVAAENAGYPRTRLANRAGAAAPQPPTAATAKVEAGRSRPNHLLLVEDNYHNAKLLLTYLSKSGCEVTWVKDGAAMWQALERSLPALILMDIHLPGEDGLSLTRKLRADVRYQSIPIIAQTAMAMSGDRAICLSAGASDYISKPIELNTLKELIAQYVTPIV